MKTKTGFKEKYGPWALVAGGSEGLGAAYAEEIARRGVSLVLVARRTAQLEQTADRLRASYAIEVRTASIDLSSEGFLDELDSSIGGLEIGLLVCNAAVAHTGPFFEAKLSDYMPFVDVNCRAHLSLIYTFGKRMVERERGGIIVMTSLSAFWGSPYVAVYGATKAFLLNLAEALWKEMEPSGVDVLACSAGPIRTPNYLASKPADEGPAALEMEPAQVAREAMDALGRRPLVVPGRLNRAAQFFMSRLMPRRTAITVLGRSTQAMFAK